MSDLLSIDWYYQSPIDLEHKQYVLLGYLQKVDKSFMEKKLSPHLMHLHKIIYELNKFESDISSFVRALEKNRYIHFTDHSLKGIDNSHIETIRSVVDFSVPQLKTRMDLGYNILTKNNQFLY